MRRRARQLARAAAAIVVLGAPTIAAAEADRAACTATVHAHVVDVTTHEAIAGAVVSVDGEVVGVTDGDGRLRARGLCPGDRTIAAERADYAAAARTIAVGRTTAVELELVAQAGEVIVVEGEAPRAIDPRSTTTLTGDALERTRGRALSDALAEVPGVAQLRTATGIAKPIIRGLAGRRLALVVDDVRHRAQDWGLDHAPEIDPFAADAITVVRGASGVRHGPDAIGGAVVVEPPPLLREPGIAGEAHLIGVSNGAGGAIAGRLRGASRRLRGVAGQIEATAKRLQASVTPAYPLDNTGVDEWTAGGAAGYVDDRTEVKLSYLHYAARLGVCTCLRIHSPDDLRAQLDRDTPIDADRYRAELGIERPYQAVRHHLAVARARRRWARAGTGTVTYALQHDRRREYDVVRDATTGPQFDFDLLTHDLHVAFDHAPIHLRDDLHLRGSAGVVGMAQVHEFVGLPLVPSHRAVGGGAFAIERLVGRVFEVEAGVRYDALARAATFVRRDFLRLVRGDQIAEDACSDPAADEVECASTFHTVSASVGGLYQLTDAWAIKLDLSTAARPPNPDEQYLSGTAPSFPVLGLGKPDLAPETTYTASITTTLARHGLTAEVSAYASRIDDYIQFAPAIGADGEPVIDVLIRGAFPRFVTRPVDALFWGADGGVLASPWPWLELGAQASVVRARDRDGGYLAFIPPDRARGTVTVRRDRLGALRAAIASVSVEHVARQDRFDPLADLADPPDAYTLVGAELGAETRAGGQRVRLTLQGSNLLDARYRDYTSALRYFADQPGWQVLLRLSVTRELDR